MTKLAEQLKQGADQAWESLSEGWRELSARASVVQCAYGSFRRDVALPVSVKPDKTKASYRDGVLRIELPKADGFRARRIVVNTA